MDDAQAGIVEADAEFADAVAEGVDFAKHVQAHWAEDLVCYAYVSVAPVKYSMTSDAGFLSRIKGSMK